MNSQYSGSLVGDDYSESSMESHAEDDNSITTEEGDENSSEEEQSSKTVLKRDQYDDILQALLMEGHDESGSERGSLCANSTCIPKGIGRCLHEQSGMDESVEKRSHPHKDHGDPRRLCEPRIV